MSSRKTLFALFLLQHLFMTSPSQAALADSPSTRLLYIGTYTKTDSKGIYAFRFDQNSGQLTALGLAAETSNPPFLNIHPDKKHLYAVGDLGTFEGKVGGAVTAFEIEPQSGKLKQLNQESNQSVPPCHILVDPSGKTLIAANYGMGSVAAFPINADGSLGKLSHSIQHVGSGPNPSRQAGPHAHEAIFDAAARFVFVPDLGLDQIKIYRLDAKNAKLTPNDPAFATVPPGSGPRHMVFGAGEKFAYVVNEISSTVSVLNYSPSNGALSEVQTISMLPAAFKGISTAAEIALHPNGKFLYASNRGHDSIAVFAIDSQSGLLTLVEIAPANGKIPRMFALSPDGNWLIEANQDSNDLVVFHVNPTTGRISPTGEKASVSMPVCVIFTSLP